MPKTKKWRELYGKMSPESKERVATLAREALSDINHRKRVEDLVAGILEQESMTAKQVVGCLMSDPYNIEWKDLDMVVDILNDLNGAGLLQVYFRKTNDILGVEALFKVIPVSTILEQN